jgi:ElaB/YqjD/DUF883 family membrane-anchored ribosome-binding protein
MALPEERVRFGAIERTVASLQGQPGARISWGGIWSGFLLGLGALLLLSLLGLAVGVSAMDVQSGQGGARGLGLGAAVWAGLELLIALFIGGLVATRTSLIADRGAAALQGALVWVLATLGLIYLTASGISLGAGALFGVLGSVTSGLGAAVGTGAAGLTGLASGDVDQTLARLDDPRTADTIAAATGMTAEEARQALSDLRTRVAAARSDPPRAIAEAREGLRTLAARAGERATQAAATAKTYVTTTSWITLGIMILALVAAVGGAMLGRARPPTWAPGR